MTNRTHHPRAASLVAQSLGYLEVIGLCVIAIATLVAGGQAVVEMIVTRAVTLADLLLLFIYLEVLAMVGVYLESGALPVRMPLYIAMVALARHLILDMKSLTQWQIVASAVAVLVLATAVLVIRYGHIRFPYEVPREGASRDPSSRPGAD
jgi:protein PsiE